MKKVLFFLLLSIPIAKAMNPRIIKAMSVYLPEEITDFDAIDTLTQLAQSLNAKRITQEDCRQLYTGIYTKAVFKRADKIKKEVDAKRKKFGDRIESISHFDATFQALKELEHALLPPEDPSPIENKIKYYLPVNELLS